jgi:hypothetical protein
VWLCGFLFYEKPAYLFLRLLLNVLVFRCAEPFFLFTASALGYEFSVRFLALASQAKAVEKQGKVH